jgi:metal-responsive CopG/Arc/MetJ family transcriptional regulator
MKTAISIDEALLKEADTTAGQMGLSRSRLFTMAVGEFLRRKRDEQMLHRLNEVYAKSPDLPEKRLLKGMKAKVRSTVKEGW